MPHIETPIQEELDRLDASIRDLRRLVVMNGGNSNPAPSAHAGEAAVLLGQEEQADALRRVERSLDALPDRIAEALAMRFEVEEEDLDDEPEGGKGKASPKPGNAKGGKPKDGPADGDPPPTRRAYFQRSALEQ